VYAYIEKPGGRGGIVFTCRPLFKTNKVTLKVRMNDKVVDRTKLRKTQRFFTVCCLKSDEVRFLNIFSANKFAILYSVGLPYYIC
jgi:hypothetical protein